MKFKVTCFRLDFNPSFCISCTEVWNLLHYTFVFLALYFCISCTKFRFFIVNACKMKHWKQKWNIRRVCFMLWNAYKSIVFVQKVKHWNMISRTICVIISVSVSAMLVYIHQKKYRSSFILERYFFVSIYPAAIPGTYLAVFLVAALLLCL